MFTKSQIVILVHSASAVALNVWRFADNQEIPFLRFRTLFSLRFSQEDIPLRWNKNAKRRVARNHSFSTHCALNRNLENCAVVFRTTEKILMQLASNNHQEICSRRLWTYFVIFLLLLSMTKTACVLFKVIHPKYVHCVAKVYAVLPFYDVKCLCSGGREWGREKSHSH